ncbi:MAG: hypothetical protein U9Q96_00140 [Patescibacteria group bacterium]|nr:hypothetical protein [Patescibacteria group bacterium]
MNKKILFYKILFFLVCLSFLCPILSSAQDINPIVSTTFGELFDRAVGVIFWMSIIVGPLCIIWGGFTMLFAGANPSNVILGKKIILYTAVIFGIILIIKSLTYFFMGDLSFS